MSNYIRLLISMDNRLTEIEKNNIKNNKCKNDIAKMMIYLGKGSNE